MQRISKETPPRCVYAPSARPSARLRFLTDLSSTIPVISFPLFSPRNNVILEIDF